jgi:hypothetical protein
MEERSEQALIKYPVELKESVIEQAIHTSITCSILQTSKAPLGVGVSLTLLMWG